MKCFSSILYELDFYCLNWEIILDASEFIKELRKVKFLSY